MNDVVLAVFGVVGLLGLASLLVPLARQVYLPYTVLLALAGAGLGFLLTSTATAMGPLADFLNALRGIDVSSEILIYVFLPPLLFAGGLTIDVRRLFDELAPVLLLAVVAVIFCTAAVGFALDAIASVGLVTCLLLGAIVSTTDTAAVINIFRDIGAPRRLSIIVEGESLFNDAAAIALYAVILGMLTAGEAPSVFNGFWLLMKGLLGGVAFGYASARVGAAIVPWLRGAVVTEITLTVFLAYVTFIVADKYIGVSGIIAVVTCALTFGVEARTRLSPGTWDLLLSIWRQLDFWAASLIFVFAAMVVPAALGVPTWFDLAVIACVYIAAIAARALVLFLLEPALAMVGIADPIDGRYKLVLLWGAMRGAVTIALALALRDHDAVPPESQHFILLAAVGFVLATLFINAPTLRVLMRALKLDKLDPAERAVRDRVMHLSRERVAAQVGKIAEGFGLAASASAGAGGPTSQLPESGRVEIGLALLTNRETELALDYGERGLIEGAIADYLLAGAGRIADAVKAGGPEAYARAWADNHAMTLSGRAAMWLLRRFGVTGPIAAELARGFECLLVEERIVQDLREFTRSDLAAVLGDDAARALDRILDERGCAVRADIEALDLQYPHYAESLRRRFLGRIGLGLEAGEYRVQKDRSIVSDEAYQDLQSDIQRRAAALERRPPLDLGLKLQAMLQKVPVLRGLGEAELKRLGRMLTPEIAMPGETIVRAGERGARMYFIASGEVEVMIAPHPVRSHAGDFFGEMALVLDRPRSADVVAVTYCNLLVLRRSDFERLMRGNPALKAEIAKVAAARAEENKARAR